jgi:hypothetical protein
MGVLPIHRCSVWPTFSYSTVYAVSAINRALWLAEIKKAPTISGRSLGFDTNVGWASFPIKAEEAKIRR